MGVVIPQVVTEDRASGAQIIDGSLKFDKSREQYLEWTPSSSGNRKTWTFSCWIKRNHLGDGATSADAEVIFSSGFNTAPWGIIQWNRDNSMQNSVFAGSSAGLQTNAFFRDTGSFLHLCSVFDTTATGNDKWRTYINGVQQTYSNSNYPSDNTDYQFSQSGKVHRIGYGEWYAGFQMSQCYFVDGQALSPTDFGFTDPLTNTWRPKKYTGTYGTNGFWLPMDGNSSIGEDKSGNGNNWTPIGFGGSNTLEKATGAFPILNTDGGGKAARPGTRTDANASNLVLALPLNGSFNDIHADIKGSGTNKTVTNNSVSFNGDSNFYGISAVNTNTQYLTLADDADLRLGNTFTVEYWAKPDSTNTGSIGLIYSKGVNTVDGFFVGNTDSSAFGRFGNGSAYSDLSYDMNLEGWHHFAWVINNSDPSRRLYIDGVLRASDANVVSVTGTDTTYVINETVVAGSSNRFSGNCQDFRVYKGLAKYTGSTVGTQYFIPASTDPDILPDTPSGVAGGSALDKVNFGSVEFDGTGDHLRVPSSSGEFTFGTGNFTFEAWVYMDWSSDSQITGSSENDFNLYVQSGDGDLRFYNGSGYDLDNSHIPKNTWTHIALVREGTGTNQTKVYVNGINTDTITMAKDWSTSRDILIGRNALNGTSYANGFISNFRIIKGTALYTSNFTPSTEPLTNVTNTVLLCCQSSDSATTAAVTPGSITAPSNGYDFRFFKAYSVYGGGERSANYFIDYSDDNSNWTNLWTGVMSNAPDGSPTCGLLTGSATSQNQGRSFGPRRYWRHREGTAVVNHYPRVSRLVLSDGVTDVNIYVNTSDNCSDSGTTNPGTRTYEDTTWTTNAANNVSASSFNPFETSVNAVRGQETGYATLNPLAQFASGTLSNGNLSSDLGKDTPCTIGVDSGKWYAEVTIVSPATSHIGICAPGDEVFGVGNNGEHIINIHDCIFIRNDAAGVYTRYGQSSGWSTAQTFYDNNQSYVTGDVIGVELDVDSGYVKFYINNILRCHATFTLSEGKIYIFNRDNGTSKTTWNFGQTPFKYRPKDGFKTLCLANLPKPTSPAAVRPDKYFDVVTYTGTSAGTQTISSLNFQPDLVWLKHRESGASGHIWTDTVRGAGTAFFSNNTSSQDTNAAAGYLSAFNSNGFTLSDGSSNGNRVKNDGSNYVAWCWKGGGGSGSGGEFWIDGVQYANAVAAGLDGGTNAPSGASINTESGFSIITYTGDNVNGARTISHGLGKKPEFVIIRNQNSTNSGGDWIIGHKGLATNAFANGKFLKFDTSSTFTNTVVFGAEPTTTLLQITSDGDAGASNIMDNGNPFIIYSWCSIPGFSKFGTHVGNNSTNGVYVDCGFRPALIWIRSTSSSRNFLIDDSTRNPYNGKVNTSTFSTNYATLAANLGSAEPQSGAGTFEGNYIDFLSNGFKLKSSAGNSNGSETYIYAAFAEAPTFNLYGGQANAR